MNDRRIDVLDHGYVELIETWGSDRRIVETARVSTQKGFLGWGPKEDGSPGDEKLLAYLADHHHDTPFEFAGAQVEVQAPIFVFREWHRHRVFSYSEASARYSPLPDINYVPTVARLMANANTANRQAGRVAGTRELTPELAEQERRDLVAEYAIAEVNYQRALSRGVPKELARIRLPVGRYSRMRAQANLRNWVGFLKLRCAPDAQQEIREYAEAVRRLLTDAFPRTMGKAELTTDER